MTPALFAGFLVFAFVSSVTPGPNNLMLMASGVNYGVRRTLPHLAGVWLGFGAMTLAIGLGLAAVFGTAPWLYLVLRWGAAAYILYLAYRMATARGVGTAVTSGRPMSFLGAAAFQWVNPKAWVMALGAVTTYVEPERLALDVGLCAGQHPVRPGLDRLGRGHKTLPEAGPHAARLQHQHGGAAGGVAVSPGHRADGRAGQAAAQAAAGRDHRRPADHRLEAIRPIQKCARIGR